MRFNVMQSTRQRRRHGAALIGLCLFLLLNLVQAVAEPAAPADEDAASLTLWADAAGLEALLGSPWAAAVTAGTPEMQRLAAGAYYHSLAIKPDDSLWAWGYNAYGQLGDGTTDDRSTPVQVLTGVAAVAAGWFHSLALKTDGSLWASGGNWNGQLGDGTTTERHTPVRVLTGVAALAAGIITAWPSRSTAASGLGVTTTPASLATAPPPNVIRRSRC
ncbi:hypothetical protein [uncultured Lamprocystis sp.]|uniref:RCC1 domain-containing protein n=1 Tax=uncultured Lamprocystis sp. TaxID=543132 RepID=UPI0025D472F6|nr:hypothetical protein [uncultured Lamprocystis sp.]